jgi:hypothetical protein
MSTFIDKPTTTWNEEKLRQYLLPMDVEIILQIPLSSRRSLDIWAWLYDRKGFFFVRSACRMLVFPRERKEAWLEGRVGASNGE